MEIVKDCKLVCDICHKEFSRISTKNRHIRNFHDGVTIEKKNIQRIRCPLCLEKDKFNCYDHLIKHLKKFHKISIIERILSFKNFENFEAWRALDNRDVDYVCHRRRKHPNGNKEIYYNCNRSDSRGFVSTCHKRKMKLGGSIRIQGICPSRIVVKIQKNGMVEVKFVETHVGHLDELRRKRVSKTKESDVLCIDEPMTSQNQSQNDLTHRLDENGRHQNNISKKFENRRQIALDEICRFGRSLGEESFDKFMMDFNKIKDRFQQNTDVCRKSKMEKQLYYPNKKKPQLISDDSN